ncbi:Melibiase subfamily [Apiospora rasikravindrae]|uniref:alpha-galactosidase n=1 Tax=Apiospora rasikravindrae TaxID=990691 RepID=A0ABR1S3B3_9PEZI
MATVEMPTEILFDNELVKVILHVDEGGCVYFHDILPADASPRAQGTPHFESSATPLCEIRLSGEGNSQSKTSKALVGSYVGTRLKYRSHEIKTDDGQGRKALDVVLQDEQTGITVTSHMVLFDGLPVLRSSTTIRNDGEKDVVVTQISSLVIAGLTRSKEWWADFTVSSATNTWFREAQWREMSLPDVGLDDLGLYQQDQGHLAPMSTFNVSNRGTFSTQGHLPLGMLKHRKDAETWLWQVENNGSWKWELGDWKDDVYLAATGPNSNDHDWRQRLAPGDSFTSATAAVCHIFGDADAAFGALTQYRRRIRRDHPDHKHLPIIFNDYMNCLMGDPTDEKIIGLIEPVAKSGAEYFVIDAGWYADDNDWWDDVGAWEPSKERFPMGFKNLLDKIREVGLKPGLWLEAEVIGVRSPVADALPPEAYFQRDGERILEKNRYQLDFRHPAVIERMDGVIDRLVTSYGVEYFKFDYNIEVTQGTDIATSSPGAGQLEHNRAYLRWVSTLLDRYPGLVIENCSSGAQRLDDAMNAVHTLQSTSDQQDPVKYAAVAAAIHTAVVPEQAATWAYPQHGWDDETNALTVVNALLSGRVHLSGRLDLLAPAQLDLIYSGMDVYREIRGDIATAVPFWPLGFAKWHDDWLAAGLRVSGGFGGGGGKCYLAVWRRGGPESCELPFAALEGAKEVSTSLLYPTMPGTKLEVAGSGLRVTIPSKIGARFFSVVWN